MITVLRNNILERKKCGAYSRNLPKSIKEKGSVLFMSKEVGHIQDSTKIAGKSFKIAFSDDPNRDHDQNATLRDFVYNLERLPELSCSHSIDDRLVYADVIRILNLANLSKKMRLALLYRLVYRLPKKKAAKKVGISVPTLDKLIIRALTLVNVAIHKKEEN